MASRRTEHRKNRLRAGWFVVWLGFGFGILASAASAQTKADARHALLLWPLDVTSQATKGGADASSLHRLLTPHVRSLRAYRLLKLDSAFHSRLKKLGWNPSKLARVLKGLSPKPRVLMRIRLDRRGSQWRWEVQLYNLSPWRRLAIHSTRHPGGLGSLEEHASLLLQSFEAHLFCKPHRTVACFQEGLKYQKGQGIAKDGTKAHSYFTQACRLNVGQGCSNLGLLYHRGQGVAKNCTRAKELYQKACQFGWKSACGRECE